MGCGNSESLSNTVANTLVENVHDNTWEIEGGMEAREKAGLSMDNVKRYRLLRSRPRGRSPRRTSRHTRAYAPQVSPNLGLAHRDAPRRKNRGLTFASCAYTLEG